MFALVVLEVLQESGGLLSRIKNFFSKKKFLFYVNIEEIKTGFYILKIPVALKDDKRKIMKKIIKCKGEIIKAGINALVFQKNFPYEEFFYEFLRVDTVRLKREYFFKTVKNILFTDEDINIILFDERLEYVNKQIILELSKHTKNIKVISENTQLLDEISRELLFEAGIPILSRIEYANSKDVIFCFSGGDSITSGIAKNCRAVFNMGENGSIVSFGGGKIIESLKLHLPFYIKNVIPQGVDEMEFLSALYNICGKRELLGLKVRDINM